MGDKSKVVLFYSKKESFTNLVNYFSVDENDFDTLYYMPSSDLATKIEVLNSFIKNERKKVLVTKTDFVAGMTFKGINLIINFDFIPGTGYQDNTDCRIVKTPGKNFFTDCNACISPLQ